MRNLPVPIVLLAGLPAAVPATAQNNGLPSRAQSAILLELITVRGEACGLLRPWQAPSLRMTTRQEMASFDEECQAEIAAGVEARSPEMACDDSLLNGWIEGAGPNFEPEYLPELLEAYRALASLETSPAAQMTTDVARIVELWLADEG